MDMCMYECMNRWIEMGAWSNGCMYTQMCEKSNNMLLQLLALLVDNN